MSELNKQFDLDMKLIALHHKLVPSDEIPMRYKKLFLENGWIDPNDLGKTIYAMPKGRDLARELAGLEQVVDDGVSEIILPLMLTGQEWYDRFKNDLSNLKDEEDEWIFEYDDVLAAAKRTSGIK